MQDGQNRVNGIVVFNIFTPQGIGSGDNYTIGKRLRDLYNRITVSSVIFDSPNWAGGRRQSKSRRSISNTTANDL